MLDVRDVRFCKEMCPDLTQSMPNIFQNNNREESISPAIMFASEHIESTNKKPLTVSGSF